MLESLTPLSIGCRKGSLVGALLVSSVLHASALVLSPSFLGREPVSSGSVARINTLRLAGSIRDNGGERIADVKIAPTDSIAGIGSMPKAADRNLEQELVARSRTLHYSSELDRMLMPISVPALEPDYGFADDVGGHIVMNVLVGKDGSVVWLNIESTGVNEATTNYVDQMFRLSRFETPTFRGVPVLALIRVEVDIPAIE